MELIIDLPGEEKLCTPPEFKIEIFDAKTLNYNNFFQNFMNVNKPCIIRNITENWESTKNWVSKNEKPNFAYLKEKYGNSKVTVYKCNERYFNSQKTYTTTFSEYIEYWKKGASDNSLDYLKDWHLKLENPKDNFYQVPVFFASDWLNEYLVDKNQDDYRFVYMGPKDTWTPFHSDVFSSFSWSANVCGKKRWLLFPAGEENRFRDNLGNLPFNVEPHLEDGNFIEIIQNPGEAVFVPSNWHHQVHNLEDTISINHNWINGCNVEFMWDALQKNMILVKEELNDCKDMDNFSEHCQRVLKASFGIDYFTFYNLLEHIATKRMKCLQQHEKLELFNGHVLGINHIIFDLRAISKVLKTFEFCEEVKTFRNIEISLYDLNVGITFLLNAVFQG